MDDFLSRLVYYSRPTELITDAEVREIITVAVRKNEEHGLTGLLAYGEGFFFNASKVGVWRSMRPFGASPMTRGIRT